MRKRFIWIAAALLLIILASIPAAAANLDVSPAPVADGTVNIPITLKDNPGLMGFRFTVRYDEAVLSDPVALRGSLTQNGLFEDSVSVSSPGSFDVIYAGTENAVGDGTVATLQFSIKETDAAQTELTVQFSETDTFDAAYQSVTIPAATIPVKISESASSPQTVPYTREATAEDVVAAVEIALQQQEAKTLVQVTDTDGFVSQVNAAIGAVTGTPGRYASTEEIQTAYQTAAAEVFVSSAVNAVDSAGIRQAIDEALEVVQAESIAQVPVERQEAFVQAVESRLAQSAPDLPLLSDTLSPADGAQAIAALEQAAKETDADGVALPQAKTVPRTGWIAIFCAAGVILIFGAGALIIKKNRKHKEEVSE